ncbi:DUF596 domain-containing protein [Photorhabdus sp. P32]|uniref:DUF596 domain-containing protein n=1 Tax=Photorhabdus sp. P32 TaxID=3117549 RepID=UPI00311B00BA
MLTEKQYQELWMAAEGQTLGAVLYYSIPTEPPPDNFSFEERTQIFFWVLERLMKDEHLKLAKYGKFLEGTVDEQLERFRQVFPKTEAEMEDGIWFFDEICPGGAVWVLEDGSFEWT